MKADNYLNLCLEQAEMSPLHHRHGCVVVKGGKVIGKGFNDHRPGYDGGALKTSNLSMKTSALEKQKQKTNVQDEKRDLKNGFKPFEIRSACWLGPIIMPITLSLCTLR